MKKIDVLVFTSAMFVIGANADFTAQFENFEGHAIDDQPAAWVGNGRVAAGSPVTTFTGVPGDQKAGDNKKVLAIEGSVTNGAMFVGMENKVASQVDMMVKAVYPDDELALPSGETGVQIAVGIDTNGCLNVYSKYNNTDAFRPISGKIESNTWVRVSFNFDYGNNRCQVSLDGLPCVSSYGKLDAGGTTQNGSWYDLATGSAKTKLSSMKVVGTTSIDDVYTSQNTSGSAIVIPDNVVVHDASGVDVKKSWIVEQGVSTNNMTTTEAPDGSGMTVMQKYITGLGVNDGIKFELKDMQPSTSNPDVMEFTFPGTTANGATFSIQGCASPNGGYVAVESLMTSEGGLNKASVNVKDILTSGVKYFKVVATK